MEWDNFLNEEKNKPYFKEIQRKLLEEKEKHIVYPDDSLIFRAFDLCPLDDLKVIIFGQDPYHGAGEANGLAFSVNKGIKIPPSLRNIFKELNLEMGLDSFKSGDLSSWARQGVLLINTVLTVRKDEARSHRNFGWQYFTNNLINFLNNQDKKYLYLLMGNDAISLKRQISYKDVVITSVHPSPLSASRGFFNSGVFLKVAQFIKEEYDQDFEFYIGDN